MAENNKNNRFIFWTIQVLLILFFGFFSFFYVGHFVYHDVLNLTVEEFKKSSLFYLSIPFGIFIFLCLADFLVVNILRFMKNKKNNEDGWIKRKHKIILVVGLTALGIIYLILSFVLIYLLFYLPVLADLLNIPNLDFSFKSFYFLRTPFSLLLFMLFIIRYVKRNLFTLDSTENGVKRVLKSPRKVIRRGLNILWRPFEDVLVICRERMELEFLVSDIRTQPALIELYKYTDEDGAEKTKYDEVDRQDVFMHIAVQTCFSDEEINLFNAVQYLPMEIIDSLQLTHIITQADIEDVKRHLSSETTEDLKVGNRVIATNRLKLVRAKLVKSYDSMIENYIKAEAASYSYPDLDKKKGAIINGIMETLIKDITFKSTGLAGNLNVYIREIKIPDSVQKSINAREVATKNKQAAISTAEGERRSAELKAKGDEALGKAQAIVEAAKKQYELEAFKKAYDMTNEQAVAYDLARRTTEALSQMNLTAFDVKSISEFIKTAAAGIAAAGIVEEIKKK